MIKFFAKPFIQGNGSYLVVIPKQYFTNQVLDVNKKYCFELKEVEEEVHINEDC